MAAKLHAVSEEVTGRAIAALQDAFATGTIASLRSARTAAALDYLEVALASHWSVEQFRKAAAHDNDTARWQNCNASLNAIRLAVAAQRSA